MPRARTSPVPAPADGTLRIQKYPNRRLYDRSTSRHLTHEELFELVAGGARVEIVESKTGADITNAVLAQVLLEHDPAKLAAFPTELFHLLVRVNQRLVPTLQQSLLQAMAQAMQGWQAWQERVAAIMPGSPDVQQLGATPLEWMLAAMNGMHATHGTHGTHGTRAGSGGAAMPTLRADAPVAAPASAEAAVAALRDEVAMLRREIVGRRKQTTNSTPPAKRPRGTRRA